MSITREGSKWEWKNSWYLLLMFVFPISFIPFFLMYGRITNKKYLVKGFMCLFAIIAVFFLWFRQYDIIFSMTKSYPEGPYVSDYLGSNYYDIPNYEETDEYKEYEKDLEVFYNTPEYKEVQEYNDHIRNIVYTTVTIVNSAGFFLVFILAITGFFIDRPQYLRELSNQQRRNNLSDIYRNNRRASAPVPQPYTSGQRGYNEPGREEHVSNENESKENENKENAREEQFDVNQLTEEEFGKISLLDVIDIKKIIDYRNQNGSFSSKDEFFECFQAKPHVIAKLQDRITVNHESKPESAKNTYYSERRFDI